MCRSKLYGFLMAVVAWAAAWADPLVMAPVSGAATPISDIWKFWPLFDVQAADIQLVLALPQDLPGSGGIWKHETAVRVRTRNTAVTRPDHVGSLRIYYQADDSWSYVAATPVNLEAGFCTWMAVVPDSSTRLAIRFLTPCGQYKWDTNNKNYYLVNSYLSGQKGVVEGNVALASARLSGYVPELFSGQVLVKNTTAHKAVFVRVSRDGWRSYEDIACVFDHTLGCTSSGAGEVESWSFTKEYTSGCGGVYDFAAGYRDLTTGAEYWDNSFSLNYQLDGFIDEVE